MVRLSSLLTPIFVTLALYGCANEVADAPNNEGAAANAPSEPVPEEEGVASLGGSNEPGATETNVLGVFCDGHEMCGAGSACVMIPEQDGGAGFSRCSFVMLADSTPCDNAEDCDGGFECLQLLQGLDAGVARICDALPVTGGGHAP